MKKIGVLGRGTMAVGIAQIFAQKDNKVTMWVRTIDKDDPRASLSSLEKGLNKLVKRERMTADDMDKILTNINLTNKYEDLADCDLIIEAISEDMNLKREVFKTLDSLCKEETILATNTSSLSITEIANSTNRPDKVVGMHFFNPVPVMKLVEVIKGIATSEETKNTIVEMVEGVGKTAVEVEEAPGFVVNRILIPMINEAIGIYAEEIATAADIDE